MRTGSQQIFGEVKRCDRLLTRHSRKVVEELIQRISGGHVVEVELTRFRGHCRSHESAVGVVHGQAQTAGVHGGVQG